MLGFEHTLPTVAGIKFSSPSVWAGMTPSCEPKHAAVPDDCKHDSPSWCPAEGAAAGDDLYLQAVLPSDTSITGLRVQGRYYGKAWGWAKTFKVQVYDGNQWLSVDAGAAFSGPSGQGCNSVKEVKFATPVVGSKLRVFPLTLGGNHPSMRIAVEGTTGCVLSLTPTLEPPHAPPPPAKQNKNQTINGQTKIWQCDGHA